MSMCTLLECYAGCAYIQDEGKEADNEQVTDMNVWYALQSTKHSCLALCSCCMQDAPLQMCTSLFSAFNSCCVSLPDASLPCIA